MGKRKGHERVVLKELEWDYFTNINVFSAKKLFTKGVCRWSVIKMNSTYIMNLWNSIHNL
jgi:hypothetical protein